MPASDKIFSRGMKGQRPPSRRGNRPGTSKSADSPICSDGTLQQRPPSRHRPISCASLDSDVHGRPSTCNLMWQNAVSVDDDLMGKNIDNYNTDIGQYPRPPSRPPSRPCSRRGRPISVKDRSRSVDIAGTDSDKTPLPHPLQTQLSFSKYKPLPSIGSNSTIVGDGESTVSTKLYETCNTTTTTDTRENIPSQDLTMSLSINQVSPEPTDSDPARLKLAVKLFDGSRHERWFRNTDTLGDVLAFARTHSVMPRDFPPCQFCTSEVPQQVFTDMSLMLEDTGLVSRSLLYLEEV